MYQKNSNSSFGGSNSRPNKFQTKFHAREQANFGSSRPSRNSGNSSHSGSSYGYRGGNRSGGGKKRFDSRSFNDLSKFINKASGTAVVEVFVPKHQFADFQVDERLKTNVIEKGYITPTPIQDQAIPEILSGRDIVGIANTGTGKTAAFLIPLINKILLNRNENVLIVVPTRELAIQIEDEFIAFAKGLNIFSACLVGGAPIYPQINALRRFPNVLIGTPGRLKDLIKRNVFNLAKFNTVVLDEADRMLDMGFIADIKFMLAMMPANRHTLFFSATLSNDISALISQFLKNPAMISVKTRDTSHTIDQDVIRVKAGEKKIEALHALLEQKDLSKVLIFGKTKHGVEALSNELIKRGFGAESIHGDKNHSARQRALGKFKNNQLSILVATDVAARGLDIKDVSHVINYDLPSTYEDYVHRIGRTGRGGKAGKALTFVD